jgi:orotate phosphoribosyltransferase
MPDRVSVKLLAEALHAIGAIRFGDFTLSSGRRSSYYVDLRLVPSHPEVYAMVLRAYSELLKNVGGAQFDAIAGIATAGVTISSPLAVQLKKPMMYVRTDTKGHGLDRLVEGRAPAGSRVVITDDLATSGGSILAAAAALRKMDYRVEDSVVLIDRLEGAASNLREAGIRLISFASISDLVLSLRESGLLSTHEAETISLQARSTGRITEEGRAA